MPPVRIAPPVWIETTPALRRLADELAPQRRIAVDTEANSLHAYRERVCLIQFSTPQKDYLVDPLALPDLDPLARIFTDPKIEKVFHAVEYDLIGLKRDFGLAIVSIFDTMQAARILGYKQVGLEAMLAEKLGVKVDKRYQKTDWARRPLTADQLNYARLDTHYLLALRDLLDTELKARDHWGLAREEFARLARGNNGSEKAELPAWQRVGNIQKLSARQLAILNELCLWREEEARRLDRPVFKVIGEKSLVALVHALPRTRQDLEKAGLTHRQIQLYGDGLLKAVHHGLSATPIQRARPARPDRAYLDRFDRLRRWRLAAGKSLGTESDLVLPKEFLYSIAAKNPQTMDELAASMPDSPWRVGTFGRQILQILAKK